MIYLNLLQLYDNFCELTLYCHGMCGYRRGLDWWLDFDHLNTQVELQLITAPVLISTLYKSLHNTRYVFLQLSYPGNCF